MHEYEIDLLEVRSMRNLIDELRADLERMIRNRDRGRECRPGKIKRWSYTSMGFLSNSYISGITAEAQRLEEVLTPGDLEIAEGILNDIEELVNEFADEELDEEGDDEYGDYYDYA